MDLFGAEWENHYEKICTNWHRTVNADDTVFIVGDISWSLKMDDAFEDLDWIRALPGTKVLLKGNHDLWWTSVGKLRARYEDMIFIQNDSCMVDERAICGSRGWLMPGDTQYAPSVDERVYNRELMRFRASLESAVRLGASELVIGMHYPPTPWPTVGSGFKQIIDEFGEGKKTTVVYGHLHGREAAKKGLKGCHGKVEYLLVAADYVNFTPVLISE
jgi:predicted phosphohydrolase